ncbi:unnamed protein product [Camellia sinensis]
MKHQQDDYADRVGKAVALGEGVSEPTRCSDVFLKQVTRDGKAYCNANPVVPYRISNQPGSNHNKKNQCPRHF